MRSHFFDDALSYVWYAKDNRVTGMRVAQVRIRCTCLSLFIFSVRQILTS